MKLQDALQTANFTSKKHMASLNVLYTAWYLKSHHSAAFKQLGLTGEQFNIMRILKGKHPEAMCVKDIASRLIEPSSNVPRIIDRLVAKKLVSRKVSKIDKRETLMQLTAKGIEKLNEANSVMEELASQLIGINETEANLLHELLEKFRKTD